MAKVLTVGEKQISSKTGNPYWEVVMEGIDMRTIAFDPIKPGDLIEDHRIQLSKDGKSYMIKSPEKIAEKSSTAIPELPDRDELIVAQCVFKGLIDLAVAGMLPLYDPKTDTVNSKAMSDLGMIMGKVIMNIARNIKK